jgi:hypothetical protein
VADSNYTKQEQLAFLTRVIRDVTRAKRLSPDDADDFSQYVHLKLLERNYDVFERFSARSSLRTFLTVVVGRLLLDWRRAMLGKWRPSAMARRLGPAAVCLDRLIYRDGLSAADAIAQLEHDSSLPPTDLRRQAPSCRSTTHAGSSPTRCSTRSPARRSTTRFSATSGPRLKPPSGNSCSRHCAICRRKIGD